MWAQAFQDSLRFADAVQGIPTCILSVGKLRFESQSVSLHADRSFVMSLNIAGLLHSLVRFYPRK